MDFTIVGSLPAKIHQAYEKLTNCPLFRSPFEKRSVNGPFDNRKGLDRLNAGLVGYSETHSLKLCIVTVLGHWMPGRRFI